MAATGGKGDGIEFPIKVVADDATNTLSSLQKQIDSLHGKDIPLFPGAAQQVQRITNVFDRVASGYAKSGKAITTTTRVAARHAQALSNAQRNMEKAAKSLSKQQLAVAQSTKHLANTTRELSDIDKIAIERLTELSRVVAVMQGPLGPVAGRLTAMVSAIRNMGAGVLTASLGLASFGAVMRKALPAAIDLQRTTATLSAATGDAAKSFQIVIEESRRTGNSYEQLAKSYAQIAAAAKGTTLEGDGIITMFKALNTASLALRLDVHQTAGALKAIEQMISKGTVSSEELRQQLGERLPGAFRLVADSMDLTTQELSKQLQQGKIMAEVMIPKLAKVIEERYGPAAEKAGQSLGIALNKLSNEVNIALGKILNQDQLNVVSQVVMVFVDALKAVAEHAAIVQHVLGMLATAGLTAAGVAAFQATGKFLQAKVSMEGLGIAVSTTTGFMRTQLLTLRVLSTGMTKMEIATLAASTAAKKFGLALRSMFKGNAFLITMTAFMTAYETWLGVVSAHADEITKKAKADPVIDMGKKIEAVGKRLNELRKEETKLAEQAAKRGGDAVAAQERLKTVRAEINKLDAKRIDMLKTQSRWNDKLGKTNNSLFQLDQARAKVLSKITDEYTKLHDKRTREQKLLEKTKQFNVDITTRLEHQKKQYAEMVAKGEKLTLEAQKTKAAVEGLSEALRQGKEYQRLLTEYMQEAAAISAAKRVLSVKQTNDKVFRLMRDEISREELLRLQAHAREQQRTERDIALREARQRNASEQEIRDIKRSFDNKDKLLIANQQKELRAVDMRNAVAAEKHQAMLQKMEDQRKLFATQAGTIERVKAKQIMAVHDLEAKHRIALMNAVTKAQKQAADDQFNIEMEKLRRQHEQETKQFELNDKARKSREAANKQKSTSDYLIKASNLALLRQKLDDVITGGSGQAKDAFKVRLLQLDESLKAQQAIIQAAYDERMAAAGENETRRKQAEELRRQEEKDALLQHEMDKTAIILEEEKRRWASIASARDEMSKLIKGQQDVNFEALLQGLGEYAKKVINIDKLTFEGKMKVASTGLKMIGTLMDSHNRKAFELGKAAAVAGAIVDTLAGVTKAFKDYPFPVSAAVGAVIAAAGALNVAKIMSTKYKGGAGNARAATPSGSAASAVPPTPPEPAVKASPPQTTIMYVNVDGLVAMDTLVNQTVPQALQQQMNNNDLTLFNPQSAQAQVLAG